MGFCDRPLYYFVSFLVLKGELVALLFLAVRLLFLPCFSSSWCHAFVGLQSMILAFPGQFPGHTYFLLFKN